MGHAFVSGFGRYPQRQTVLEPRDFDKFRMMKIRAPESGEKRTWVYEITRFQQGSELTAHRDREAARRFLEKRRIRPMLGFKSFWTARIVLGSVELVHMLRKGQLTPGFAWRDVAVGGGCILQTRRVA